MAKRAALSTSEEARSTGQTSAWRSVAIVVALLGTLTSCARPVRPPEPPREVSPAPTVDTRGAKVYTIDSEASRVHILVYRGGTLARLGHNHVVTSRSLTGRAWLHPTFERSGFELTMPVHSLIVDDPEEREVRGKDFPPGISPKDVEGTRNNMLKAEVLDAGRYPLVSLRAARVAGTLDAPVVTARITIKGVAKEVSVPMKLSADAEQLTARGELEILQTAFGMKPFSIALGAIEVQDRLHLEFDIVAKRDARG